MVYFKLLGDRSSGTQWSVGFYFLIEANPGPGLALAAYLSLVQSETGTNAAASVFVQVAGGFMKCGFRLFCRSLVLLGPIVGGFSGTLIFQFLG